MRFPKEFPEMFNLLVSAHTKHLLRQQVFLTTSRNIGVNNHQKFLFRWQLFSNSAWRAFSFIGFNRLKQYQNKSL